MFVKVKFLSDPSSETFYWRIPQIYHGKCFKILSVAGVWNRNEIKCINVKDEKTCNPNGLFMYCSKTWSGFKETVEFMSNIILFEFFINSIFLNKSS